MLRCQSAWLSWTSAALIPTQKTYSAQWPSSKLSHFYSSLNWSHWIFFKNVQKCLKHYWYEIPSMITEMWSRTYKRVITECQRKKLRSLAWRRLNKILPWRYLHWLCFFWRQTFHSSSNQTSMNQLISFSCSESFDADMPIDPQAMDR